VKAFLNQCAAIVTAWAMFLYCMPAPAAAQEHILSPQELHRELQRASETRANDLAAVDRILKTDVAQKAMKNAGLHAPQVQKALSQLSDSELSRLAAQARSAEQDLAAGVSAVVAILAIIGAIVVIVLIVRAVA
jgi:hypothetical protein